MYMRVKQSLSRYSGPAGTGKTSCAIAIAKYIYGSTAYRYWNSKWIYWLMRITKNHDVLLFSGMYHMDCENFRYLMPIAKLRFRKHYANELLVLHLFLFPKKKINKKTNVNRSMVCGPCPLDAQYFGTPKQRWCKAGF